MVVNPQSGLPLSTDFLQHLSALALQLQFVRLASRLQIVMDLHPQSREASQRTSTRGFTLIELVIGLAILALLAGMAMPRITSFQARARDSRRVADMKIFRDAVERFRLDLGRYPASSSEVAGWDTSLNGTLASELLAEGYASEVLLDPGRNTNHYFRFRVYPKGSQGCFGPGPFYVVGIQRFETQWARDRFQSQFKCSGHDWSTEFEFVMGGGASYSAPSPPSGPGL
ncbi:MAG: general secretion pathway protein G [Planctomycetota bacterium]